jgi:hypothetical protein
MENERDQRAEKKTSERPTEVGIMYFPSGNATTCKVLNAMTAKFTVIMHLLGCGHKKYIRRPCWCTEA